MKHSQSVNSKILFKTIEIFRVKFEGCGCMGRIWLGSKPKSTDYGQKNVRAHSEIFGTFADLKLQHWNISEIQVYGNCFTPKFG